MSTPRPPGGTNPPASGTGPPTGATNPPRSARPVTGPSPRVPVSTDPRPTPDLATRLDGQRGWLNELDRSLKKRSIIALVLTCLAVGVGAAALYISISKNSDTERISALETRVAALEAASNPTGITEPTTVLPETGVTVPETVLPDTGTTGTTDGTVPVPITPTE